MTLTFLIIVIIVALVFEFMNGAHDTANSITTVVSTKVLSPRKAVIFAALLNILGAFFGTHVAKTISSGLVDTATVNQMVILCALIGGFTWNLITWFAALPSSSSHALVGGLIGAAVAKSGFSSLKVDGIVKKVLIPMFTSPLLGMLFGFFLTLLAMRFFYYSQPDRINRKFKRLQLISAGFMAFSHGSNDSQKTMGIITLTLVTYGAINSFNIPYWVICLCAVTMGLGTLIGGWRIIRTMGTKVVKLKPLHGFIAETTASSIILIASFFGIPISTTHVISTAIVGVGTAARSWDVRWSLVSRIVWAWIFTIPCAALMSYSFYIIFNFFDHL